MADVQVSDQEMCGNQSCTSTGAQSLRKCGGCHSVSYCSPQCQRQDWARHKGSCGPVTVATVAGMGRGLLATRDIGAGQLIFKENPVISVTLPRTDCCASCDTMGMKQYGVWMEIQEKVDKLDPENRNKFNRLTRMENMKPRPRNINLEVICTKFYNNAKLVKGSDGRDHRMLFLRLSLGNHSCDPNSRLDMTEDSSGVVARLTALKDIKKGEEVTYCYTYLCGDHMGDTRIRKTLLREQFDFLCRCALCVNNPPGFEEELSARMGELRAHSSGIFHGNHDGKTMDTVMGENLAMVRGIIDFHNEEMVSRSCTDAECGVNKLSGGGRPMTFDSVFGEQKPSHLRNFPMWNDRDSD